MKEKYQRLEVGEYREPKSIEEEYQSILEQRQWWSLFAGIGIVSALFAVVGVTFENITMIDSDLYDIIVSGMKVFGTAFAGPMIGASVLGMFSDFLDIKNFEKQFGMSFDEYAKQVAEKLQKNVKRL